MSTEESVAIISQTMRDLAERKITMRHALTMSRVALALSKAIEVADLNSRIEFLEQVLKKKK